MFQYNTLPTRHGLPQKQKGIATILIVVLVGLALTASGFAITHTIRNTQEKHVAVNATTHAQTGAWVGAEAFRRYLAAIDVATLLAFQGGNLDIDITAPNNASYGNITAQNIVAQDLGGDVYRVTADIVNVHDTAKSSAALGVVYEISLPSPPSALEMNAALNFYDNLDVLGSIGFVSPASGSTEINVDGSLTAMTVGLENVSVVRATGAVNLGSQVNIERVYSNEDVTVTGGAWVDEIYTAGRIFLHGGAGTLAANGDILIATSTAVISADSRSDIEVTAGNHGNITAGGEIDLDAWAQGVQAVGDINLLNIIVKTTSITTESNLNCPTSDNLDLGVVSINGSLGPGCVLNEFNTTSHAEGQNNTVPVMAELAPIEIPPLMVDVWRLKDQANYIFEYDAVAGEPKVTVRNINGIPDGEYKMGRYANNAWSYICETVESGMCTAPTDRYIPICLGSSEWMSNPCLRYDVSTETWSFSQSDSGGSISTTAPGIMWFDGNLSINSGLAYTTYLVTGNVTDGGVFTGAAANYGDYAEMCEAQGNPIVVAGEYSNSTYQIWRSDYTSLYSGFYPTNLCNVSEGTYTPIPAGNISIASGGYNPDDGGAYSGGDISLGRTTRVWGTLLAGGHLETNGSAEIFGYVNAAALSDNGVIDNSLGGGTRIDLSLTTDNFNPAIIPNMTAIDAAGGESGGAAQTGTQVQSRILWSRHL